MTHSMVLGIGAKHSLTFYCGELPADAAVFAAQHEPNGYFWEAVAIFVAPEIAGRLELESEDGMFSASGSKEDCDALQARIEPLLSSADSIGEVIASADETGFQFDE